MWTGSRRDFLQGSARGLAAAGLAASGLGLAEAWAQVPGDRPRRDGTVAVLNPRMRVPLSLIIDDSTCLVNMAYFGMPQFAQTWPENAEYRKAWQKMPREIPDAFVRKFGGWCAEQGVKGKYSIVPYPACVGWIDRYLPGWSEKQLRESLDLVRTLITPNFDIHPEMVSHTRVIDTKTGRPYADCSPRFMENWAWTDGKSVDELTGYLAYALRILKNVDLPCEGITTPGGFGNGVLPELAQATLQSCRDVYGTEIPHYFRHLFTDKQSVAPRVEYASGLDGPDPKCVVSIIGCTGDWFGGWDGLTPGSADLLITEDLKSGRMVDVIERGEPAIIVCHWPGVYCGGEETGFRIFQESVHRLHARYDNVVWMKQCEIARYWAAKELTQIQRQDATVTLNAPFAAPAFTVQVSAPANAVPKLTAGGQVQELREVTGPLQLAAGTWTRESGKVVVCFDLRKGESRLTV